MCHFVHNRHKKEKIDKSSNLYTDYLHAEVQAVHSSISEYKPTPLVNLEDIASDLRIGNLFVKDESSRFGLKAFKALGASYALYKYFEKKNFSEFPNADKFYCSSDWLKKNSFTFTTATDGNHGRGVAWAARKLNQKAVIYMPDFSVKSRVENIRNEGAEVILVKNGYDKAVLKCRQAAEAKGWTIISDQAWTGYEDIPRWISAGYKTIFNEIKSQLPASYKIDIALIQGGVGALLASAVCFFKTEFPGAKIVCIEPVAADCLLRSAATPDGNPITIENKGHTIMAGLYCHTPSPIAWPIIRDNVDLFLAISDSYIAPTMRKYYYGKDQIISGETGASGLAALWALRENQTLQEAIEIIGLTPKANVFIINTEGDTDPVNFQRIIESQIE